MDVGDWFGWPGHLKGEISSLGSFWPSANPATLHYYYKTVSKKLIFIHHLSYTSGESSNQSCVFACPPVQLDPYHSNRW